MIRDLTKPAIVSVATRDGFILTEAPAERPISQRKAKAAIREYVATEELCDPKPMATRRFFPRIAPDIMPLIELIVLIAAGFLGAYVITLILKGVLS